VRFALSGNLPGQLTQHRGGVVVIVRNGFDEQRRGGAGRDLDETKAGETWERRNNAKRKERGGSAPRSAQPGGNLGGAKTGRNLGRV